MPAQYDPEFDPEELRRRRMLNSAMADDPGDAETGLEDDQPEVSLSGRSTAMSAPTLPIRNSGGLTPAQQNYRGTLETVPDRANFQPSKKRRVLAAIAGGFAGIKDPRAGASISESIVDQPYNHAMEDWTNHQKAGALDVGIDKDVNAQQVARDRAAAYSTSATARQALADSAGKLRDAQIKNLPWNPHTEEESTRQDQRRHPKAAPARGAVDQEREWMQADPAGFQKYMQMKHTARTVEEQNQVEAFKQSAIAKNRRPLQPRNPIAPAPPAQQQQAEHMAAQQLVRENPEFAPFYKGPQSQRTNSGGNVNIPGRFLDISEIESANPKKSLLGFGSVSDQDASQASLARELHRQFQAKVKERTARILGSKAPNGGGDDWEVSEEEEQQ